MPVRAHSVCRHTAWARKLLSAHRARVSGRGAGLEAAATGAEATGSGAVTGAAAGGATWVARGALIREGLGAGRERGAGSACTTGGGVVGGWAAMAGALTGGGAEAPAADAPTGGALAGADAAATGGCGPWCSDDGLAKIEYSAQAAKAASSAPATRYSPRRGPRGVRVGAVVSDDRRRRLRGGGSSSNWTVAGHRGTSCWAHLAQNLADVRLSAPQFEQIMLERQRARAQARPQSVPGTDVGVRYKL